MCPLVCPAVRLLPGHLAANLSAAPGPRLLTSRPSCHSCDLLIIYIPPGTISHSVHTHTLIHPLSLPELQKQERKANSNYGKTFKPQASKEDKQAKRKQILSSIGEAPCASWRPRRHPRQLGLLRAGGRWSAPCALSLLGWTAVLTALLHWLLARPPTHSPQARTCWWPQQTSPSGSRPPSPVRPCAAPGGLAAAERHLQPTLQRRRYPAATNLWWPERSCMPTWVVPPHPHPHPHL